MKKKLIFLLAAIICICFFAFGGSTKKGEIGKTYTSQQGIEFTLNHIEFTDTMDNLGGANDNYWKPLPENPDRNQLKYAVTPNGADETICVISFTAKNTSKYDRAIDEIGTLNYDDGYKYSKGGLSYRVSAEGVWSDIPNGLKLVKLKEKSYEFRAYMVVPKVLATETDKALTYELFGIKFDLR